MHASRDSDAPARLVVGWVLAADVTDPTLLRALRAGRDRLRELLSAWFPEFTWEMPFVERRVHPPSGALDPLELLELGAEEKLARHWDYVLVVVPNELTPRHRLAAVGIPSSALETAVLSTARLGNGAPLPERIAAVALHLLGHLFGLGHADSGPMRPFDDPAEAVLDPYPPEQREAVVASLREATDARLEEQRARWAALAFYWRTFWSDPRGIVRDVLGVRPWNLPLYLGRLTAAAAVSLVYLLLTAESWEVGAHLDRAWLLAAPVLAILLSAAFLFWGQNLAQAGREHGWREQLARTRIVLFATLVLGLASFWFVLFAVSWAVAAALPVEVFAGWAGVPARDLSIPGYAAFMATIGVLAAALGGNLEEEAEIKAELLFDEET